MAGINNLNVFALISFVSFLVSVMMGLYVFSQNPKNRMIQLFFASTIIIDIWALSEFIYRHVGPDRDVSILIRLPAFGYFIFPIFLHFTLHFVKKRKILANPLFLVSLYLPAAFFSFLFLLTDKLIKGAEYTYWGWSYTLNTDSSMTILSAVWQMILLVISYFVIIKSYPKLINQWVHERKQVNFILAGLIIPTLLGLATETILPLFGKRIPELSTAGFIFMFIFVGYSIKKFKLFKLTLTTAADNIISTMKDIVILLTPEGKIERTNISFIKVLGYNFNEIHKKPLNSLIKSTDPSVLEKRWQEIVERDNQLSDHELFFKAKDGREILFSCTSSSLFDDEFVLKGIVLVCRDLTDRKSAEEAVLQSETRYKSIVELSTDLIALTIYDKIVYINQSGAYILNKSTSSSSLIGKSIYDFIDNDFKSRFKKKIEAFYTDEDITPVIDVPIVSSEGKTLDLELLISPVPFKANIALQIIGRDITHHKNYQKSLEKISSADPLTGIANRRKLEEYLYQVWRLSERNFIPLSIIMADIDNFKNYNDTYGHQAGDECLKTITRVMKMVVHRPADLIARYGGEEFIVVLPETNPDGAHLVAKRLRKAVKNEKIEHSSSSTGVYVTVSLGVATVIPSKDMGPDDLIKMADDALYEAKRGGKNRVSIHAITAIR